MSKDLLDIQNNILNDSYNMQLVSASAGSGKTFIMIKKISEQLIDNNLPLEQTVVITFTVLASLEMKNRLKKDLELKLENAKNDEEINKYTKLIEQLKTANIDTIDAFCSTLVKKYFFKLNIEPNIQIISNMSSSFYKNEAFKQTIEEYGNDDENLNMLVDAFEKNARNYSFLQDAVFDFENFLSAQFDAKKFIADTRAQFDAKIQNSTYATFVNKNIIDYFEKNKYINFDNIIIKNSKINEIINIFCKIIEKFNKNNDFFANYNLLNDLSAISFKGLGKVAEEDKADYNIVYNTIKEFQEYANNYIKKLGDINLLQEKYDKTNNLIDIFINFYEIFHNNYEKIKKENSCLDFSDVQKLTIELINDNKILDEIQKNYCYFFVDEFQDVNPLQYFIITKLSEKAKKFYVGDPKQSIYGFREAEPTLFSSLEKQIKAHKLEGEAYNMNLNFRSSPQILNFIDEVFLKIMTESVSDIDYSKSSFEPQRIDFPIANAPVKIFAIEKIKNNQEKIDEDNKKNLPVYSILNNSTTKNENNEYLSAKLIAKEILNLVNKPFYDAQQKQVRNLNFSDICLLARSIRVEKIQVLLEVFKSYDIPVNFEQRTMASNSESINYLIALLSVIAGYTDDVAYVTFATSSFCKLSLEELAKIKMTTNSNSIFDRLKEYAKNNCDGMANKIEAGFELLKKIQTEILASNIKDIIEILLYRHNFYLDLLCDDVGKNEYQLLEQFINSLTETENALSLSAFLTYCKNNENLENKSIIKQETDSVNIVTIHGSKGLEFPVVFLFDADALFNKERKDILFETTLGVGINYFDFDNRESCESIQRLAVKKIIDDKAFKEELRLLYVALTRAKNNLYIFGDIERNKIENNKTQNCYLDLILANYVNQLATDQFCDTFNFKNVQINFVNPDDKKYFEITTLPQNENAVTKNEKEFDYEKFVYENAKATTLSEKNNVTAITKQLNEDFNIMPHKFDLKESLHLPKDEVSNVGTQYHSAFEKMDFAKPFVESQNELLDNKLLALGHKAMQTLTNNCNLKREAKFMIRLPYCDFFPNTDIKDKILVQGVIDLLIEKDDGFEIVDYKYSSLDNESIEKTYANQLKLYKIAVEKCFHKTVKKCLIYSIKTGQLIGLSHNQFY